MNRDEQTRGQEKMRKLRIPERFKGYRVMLAPLPDHPAYDVIYDMPMKTIWVNTAAAPDANVSIVKPGR